MKAHCVRVLLAGMLAGAPAATAQKQPLTDVPVQANIYQPADLDPTDERVRQLQAPAGFRVRQWAAGLKNPRIITVAEDGAVYVTRRDMGDVVLLRDANNDGQAEQPQVVAQRPGMHGIVIRGKQVYLATVKELFVAERKADGTLGPLKTILTDLPDGGQHPNRVLAFGPDGLLYVSIGSSCNACPETNPEHATLVRMKPDGSARKVFASGLRNTIGFGWHPETKQMWGWDHGIDWLGNEEQREEINLLVEDAQYGWPYVYENSKFTPHRRPKDKTNAQWAQESKEPALLHTAHSSGLQWVFYTGGQFPAEYRHDAFVTLRGSWNRKPPSGYEVVRVRFENGKPSRIEPFLSGFLIQQPDGTYANMGRLCGLAQMPDGSLLVGDDTGGVIYRVSYEAGRPSRGR